MSDRDRAWDAEHHRAALQIITEADRGMKVAEQQLKAGRLMDARETVRIVRGLLPPLERVIQRRPVRAEDATMGDPTPETLAELRRLAKACPMSDNDPDTLSEWYEVTDLTERHYPIPPIDSAFIAAASPAVVLGLLDRLAHMAEARDNARAEVERLAGLIEAAKRIGLGTHLGRTWPSVLNDVLRALDGEADRG